MRRQLTLLMSMGIFLLHLTQAWGQDAISQKVNQHISAIQQTTMYTPLEAVVDTPEKLPNIPETLLAEKQLFRLSSPATGAIQERSSEYLQMTISVEGQNTELQLIEADIFTDDFRAVFASAPDVELDVDMGRHYWGIVKDAEESLAIISFFDNEIIGAVSMNNSQYTLGKIKDSEYHILYKNSDLNYTSDFSCEALPPPTGHQDDTIGEEVVDRSNRCIRIHIEADYSLFQKMGGLDQTSKYIYGVFAEVAELYANESVNIKISYLNIWNVPSPYTGGDFLSQIRARAYGNTYGDFVHLIHTRAGNSGSAYINTFCNPNLNVSQSSVDGSYSIIPTYSWDVHVIAHELGHNFGSRHTHDCVWNGNNTAIDRCGTETRDGIECGGSIPSDGGTIMSYCQELDTGINFAKGFDPQPANLIRNNYNAATCLQSCDGSGGSECNNRGGLQANYYNNMNLSGSPISRIDPTVDFNWGIGSPDAQIGNDNYSVRWEGSIESPTSGNYTFYTNTDDGVRLWINDNLIIDKWVNQAPREWSDTINMTAGQKVNIKMEYFENGGGAMAQLLWSGPGLGKQIIPGDRLFNCVGGSECTNSGGLQANYYSNMNLSGSPINRIDPTVDFNWGIGSPDAQIGNDNYSVRWEGSIESPTSGNYTFYTNTDDGVRLWINDNLIIDKWVNQAPREWSGTINMTAGQKVSIKMEYFENGGGAVAQLFWSGPGLGKQIIPSDRLFNCVGGTNSSDCEFNLLPGAALDVGAGGGKTFVIGTNRRVYEWNGADWNIQPAGPQANRIDVETSGIPWIVATDGRIYRLVNNQWQNISGWASDVGCGANKVYVIGGGNRIYMWNGGNGFTEVSSGAGVRIDVDGDGSPWIVGTDGLVYQYIVFGWYAEGNFASKDISIQEGGNRVWGLASSNGQVTLYKGNGTWEPQSGAADHLSVNSNGDVWVVNVNRQIFTNSCSANLQSAPNPTIANLVYPNPTSAELFLNLDPYYLDKNLDYTITNVRGQLVDRGTFSSIYSDVVEVDVSSAKFPIGTYFLSLTTNDTKQVIKFVVIK